MAKFVSGSMNRMVYTVIEIGETFIYRGNTATVIAKEEDDKFYFVDFVVNDNEKTEQVFIYYKS